MSRKRKLSFEGMQTMDIEETPDDLLFDFLMKSNNSSRFSEIREIFNNPFDLSILLNGLSSRLGDLQKIFKDHTEAHATDRFVHYDDAVGLSSTSRSNVYRKWMQISDEYRKWEQIPDEYKCISQDCQ